MFLTFIKKCLVIDFFLSESSDLVKIFAFRFYFLASQKKMMISPVAKSVIKNQTQGLATEPSGLLLFW